MDPWYLEEYPLDEFPRFGRRLAFYHEHGHHCHQSERGSNRELAYPTFCLLRPRICRFKYSNSLRISAVYCHSMVGQITSQWHSYSRSSSNLGPGYKFKVRFVLRKTFQSCRPCEHFSGNHPDQRTADPK